MILDPGIATSNAQLQPLPQFDFSEPIIFSIEVIAAMLALIGAFYFYRFYKITRSIHLLGPIIGFSFITFAEVLLAADVWLQFNPQIFNLLFWMRLLCLSYGFSFIAVSYFYKHREADKTMMMKVAALSAVSLIIMMAIIVIVPPVLVLPPYNEVDEYFRVFNLFMLGYVFKSTLGSIVQQGRKEFMYMRLGHNSIINFMIERLRS